MPNAEGRTSIRQRPNRISASDLTVGGGGRSYSHNTKMAKVFLLSAMPAHQRSQYDLAAFRALEASAKADVFGVHTLTETLTLPTLLCSQICRARGCTSKRSAGIGW